MPHRQPLLALLSRYRPIDAGDADQARRLTGFVEREPACFERGCLEGHITGSAWLVAPDGHRVLLTHHRKLERWFQLGGHADGNADVLAVAMREAREESGIDDLTPASLDIFDLDVHPIPARENEPEHLHYDVRFALRAGHDRFRVSGESHALAWIPIDRLADRTSEPSMLRMAAKWLSARFPS